MFSLQEPPVHIKYLQKTRILEITFADGMTGNLPCAYLRAYSPSAEGRDLAKALAPRTIQKRDVSISSIEPVGNYAVRFFFDDGHNTGIYNWALLRDLTSRYDELWTAFLAVNS